MQFFFGAHFVPTVRVRPQCTCSLSYACSLRCPGDLGPRQASAGCRGVQPAFVLQDLMHNRFAGTRGDRARGRGVSCVQGDPSTSLLADPCGSSLKREGARCEGCGCRIGCSVVAERVKQTASGTESCASGSAMNKRKRRRRRRSLSRCAAIAVAAGTPPQTESHAQPTNMATW